MNMTEWAENEVKLACTGEPDDEVLDKYAESCYQSALKAFKSLCEDGHSGMSIGLTLGILNRLVKGLPLSPIEGKDDEWEVVERGENNVAYQNKRCSALFKKIKDGKTKYDFVDKTVVFYNGESTAWRSCHASRLVDELHPTTLPFMPKENRYKVYCNTFAKSEEEDNELREYTYLINPDGEREEINRYFIFTGNEVAELTIEEFNNQMAVWGGIRNANDS